VEAAERALMSLPYTDIIPHTRVLGRRYFPSSAFEPAQAARNFGVTPTLGHSCLCPNCTSTAVLYPKAKIFTDAEAGCVEGHADAKVRDLPRPPNRQVVLLAVGR
jgi:hypothetical protein